MTTPATGASSTHGTSTWGRRVRRLIFSIIPALVVIGLFETSLRLGYPETARYRTFERLRAPTAHGGILILGDSFSLERPGSVALLLREHLASRDVGCSSLARSGTGPLEYREALRTFGAAASPRLVLLDYYVGNDLTDTAYRLQRDRPATGALKRLLGRTHIGALLKERRQAMVRAARLHAIEASRPDGTAPTPHNPFLLEVARRHPDYLEQNLLVGTPEARATWKANEAALDEVKALAAGLGARLVVSVFPHCLQVNADHVGFYRACGFQVDEGRLLGSRIPQDLILAWAREREVPVLDLLPDFRARSEEALFIENDDHWNDRGNALAFERIRDGLEALGLPETAPVPR